MLEESFTCPACYIDYDHLHNLPRIIFSCGHSICSNCITKLLGKDCTRKCPIDSNPFDEKQKTIEAFPINFTLSQLIEEKQKLEVCDKHKHKLRLICLTDRVRICDACAYSEEHTGHKLQLVSKIKGETKVKKDELNKTLEVLNKHQKSMNTALEEQRSLLQRNVKEKIQEMHIIFSCKEFEINSMLSHAIESEKEKTSKAIGKDSELAKKLRMRIEGQDLHKTSSDIIDEESALDNINTDELIELYLHETTKKIKEASEHLDAAFDEEKNCIFNQYNPVSQLIDQLDAQFNEKDLAEANKLLEKDGGTFEFVSEFDVKIRDSCLTISISGLKTTVLNLEQLKAVQRVELILGRYDLMNDHIKVLYYIWQHISRITSLQVIFNPCEITDGYLIQLLPAIFNQGKDLEEIEIWLEGCSVGDDSMNVLFTQIMNKMIHLKSIKLILDGTKVSDISLLAFAQKVLPVVKDLEKLRIDLYGTEVNNTGFIEMFHNVEKLKELYLHLHNTGVSDKAIEALVENGLSNMSSLTKLNLWLGSTKVTDQSITRLLTSVIDIKSLKELKLNLMSTEVTDNSMSALERAILADSNLLDNLILDLKSTKVSEEAMERIYAMQSKLNKKVTAQSYVLQC